MNRYLIDSNVLIEANNHYYGTEFCPAFWDWLVRANGYGQVASIVNVAQEIRRRSDAVSEWVLNNEEFFLALADSVLSAGRLISDWLSLENFRNSAVLEFLSLADYWLVAYAYTHKFIVVTQEIAADTPRKVKIPNVCSKFDVAFMNTFEMLRQENPKFVLD